MGFDDQRFGPAGLLVIELTIFGLFLFVVADPVSNPGWRWGRKGCTDERE
jgi:hypothetical protein